MDEDIQITPSKKNVTEMQSSTKVDVQPSKTRQTLMQSATQIAEQETTQSKMVVTAESSQLISEEGLTSEKPKKARKWRRVKRKRLRENLVPTEIEDIEGVRKICISQIVQNIIKCRVGEEITAENPWKYILKEPLEDNLELHEESSEFLPLKEEILAYPGNEILIIYIPEEMSDNDEFYLCLTESAEATVSEIIVRVQQQREERLNNSVFKSLGQWDTWGSEAEVQDLQVINNRPLLEVEVSTEYPIMSIKNQFHLRLVEHARDGYAEILSKRQIFHNVDRKKIDASVQVTPALMNNESQTVYRYPKNMSTQYEFTYPPAEKPGIEFKVRMQSFLDNDIDNISDILSVNSNINFYKNDYEDLVPENRYSKFLAVPSISPYTCLSDPSMCSGKEIVCHSWHQMWTGIVAISYGDAKLCDFVKQRPNKDEVFMAIYDVTPVLIWSFDDTLKPKLLLETPRQITALSWCPYKENYLVGGCANGQIVVWDITNKLQSVEEEEVLTIAQTKYRVLMNSKMIWMKNTKDLKVVPPTVISELQYSHTSMVSCLRWISPYREISKSGKVKDIPESENRISVEFISASTDGTVLVWDINIKAGESSNIYRSRRKLRHLQKRPSGLTVDVSPLRVLNRILKPLFKINVLAPNSNRLLPISDVSLRITKAEYVEANPDPNRKFKVTDRIIYKPVFETPKHPLVNKFIAGTMEGDFIIAAWDGYDFNSGEIVNKENCRLDNFGKYHDGPISVISRSSVNPELMLTVGGKVFAIWKSDFIGKPLLWRKGKIRYTHAVWNRYRPSMFRLSRIDGNAEMWHLKVRSDSYIQLIFISTNSLGSCTTHPFRLAQNIMGVVDGKGLFRLFFVHMSLMQKEVDANSIIRFCERATERKSHFMKWQEQWRIKHADRIKDKLERDIARQREQETEAKREREELENQAAQLKKEIDEIRELHAKPQPGLYEEWARRQLLLRENERMMKEILHKKSLDLNVLQKQRAPLLAAIEEETTKKKNQEKRISMAKKIFDDTVASLFPESIEKKPPPTPDPYAGGDSKDVKTVLYENYLEVAKICEKHVKEKQYTYKFDWGRIIESGKIRRRILDDYYNRYSHKMRLIRERAEKQKLIQAPPETEIAESSVSSLGSIDYETKDEEDVMPELSPE